MSAQGDAALILSFHAYLTESLSSTQLDKQASPLRMARCILSSTEFNLLERSVPGSGHGTFIANQPGQGRVASAEAEFGRVPMPYGSCWHVPELPPF